MTSLHHLGITVDDVPRASAQFDPVLAALGYDRAHNAEDHAYWRHPALPEILHDPPRSAD